MKRLLKITTKLGSANSVAFIASLVKNKFIAVFLGTSGVGIFAQLNNFLNLLSNLSTLGMQQGVTKFSASCKLDETEEKVDSESILSVALFLVGSIAMVLSAAVIFFNKKISFLIFSDASYGFGIIIVAVSFPFIAFTAIFNYYFKGIGNIGALFKTTILSSIIGLAVSFSLIWLLSIKGLIMQIFTTAFISFSVFYLFYSFFQRGRKKARLFDISGIPGAKTIIRNLLRHGFVIYVSNALLPLSLLIIRSMVIKNFGIEQNGIFQSVLLISAIFVSFPSETLWASYFPDISKDRDPGRQKVLLARFMDFLILIGIPAVTFTILLQNFVIKFLFSSHFVSAASYLPVRLMGDFVYMLAWPIGLIFFANSLFKEVLFFSILWNLLLIGLSALLIKLLGFEGVFIAYLLTCLIILILQWIILRKKTVIAAGNRELLRVILAVISVSMVCFVARERLSPYFYLLPLFIWFCMFFNKFKLNLEAVKLWQKK